MAADIAAMCMPCAMRASRSSAPAVLSFIGSAIAASLIGAPAIVCLRLGRLRETVARLRAELAPAVRIAPACLDARGQPHRLRAHEIGIAADTLAAQARP